MKIKVIIGSTRQGRSTQRAAQWVVSNLDESVDSEILDLIDYDLPFMNEAVSPQYNTDRKPTGVVKAWLDKLADADGVIIVTPEYNRSIPAVLKNALDQVAFELKGKVVGIVAHGSSGGAQAVAHLRSVLPGLLAYSSPTAVYLPGMAGMIFDDDGKLNSDYASHQERLVSTLAKQTEEISAICSCNCQCKDCDNATCTKCKNEK